MPSAVRAAASVAVGAARQSLLDPASPQRRRAHTGETDLHASADTGGSDTDGGPVLFAAHVLQVRPGRHLRDPNLGQHFLPLERSVERAGEELRRRDGSLPSCSSHDEVGVERQQDRGEIGGRVPVRNRAADRAAMTNLRVADQRGRVGDQRAMRSEHRVADERRVARERADRNPVTLLADVAQVVQAADVDEQRRPRDPQSHGRDERVPARQELRVLVATEQLECLVDRSGALVVEGRRDHAPALAAAWTARTMLWYPVQRHRFPSSPSRISSSVGFGFSSSSEIVAITNPGVQ